MSFDSTAATLLPRLQRLYKDHIKVFMHAFAKYDDLRFSTRRLITLMHQYQLVDMRQLIDQLDEDAIEVMVKDVINSNELPLPFNQFAIWVNDTNIAFIEYAEYIDNKADRSGERIVISSATIQSADRASLFPFLGSVSPDDLKAWEPHRYVTDMPEDDREYCLTLFTSLYSVLCVLAFLLHHKKLELPAVTVPTQRNAKRIKRDQPPYIEYKVAKFKPIVHAPSEPQGGTHASPKMHIRIGHWRRKPHSEVKTWVRAAVVGDPSRGIVFKSYKVDQLHD